MIVCTHISPSYTHTFPSPQTFQDLRHHNMAPNSSLLEGLVVEEEEAGTSEATPVLEAVSNDYNESYMSIVDHMCQGSSTNATLPSPELLRFVVYGVLLTTVGLLGLAGNLISITILSRYLCRQRDSSPLLFHR